MNISHANYPKVSSYVAAWKQVIELAIASPDSPVILDWCITVTAQEARRTFLAALDRRINHRAGLDVARGRKDCEEYSIQEYRDQQAIHDKYTKRIRIYRFETREAQKRFTYLVDDRNEN
jgi:hypothetical protein